MYLAINIAIHHSTQLSTYLAMYTYTCTTLHFAFTDLNASVSTGFDLAGALRMLKVDRSVEPVSQEGFVRGLTNKNGGFCHKEWGFTMNKNMEKHMKHGALAWKWQSEMMK